MPRVVADKDKKKARMEMRITEEDKVEFDEAAQIVGANDASEWGRQVLRREARSVIATAKQKKKR